jgi:hypothetical protein
MDMKIIIIIAAAITALSFVLRFSKLAMENVSIFLNIRKTSLEIKQLISKQKSFRPERKVESKNHSISIADVLSGLALTVVSYKLFGEYRSIEPLTREIVFNIAFLFSFAVFNVISIVISVLEDRLGNWVDNFMSALEQTLEIVNMKEDKKNLQ